MQTWFIRKLLPSLFFGFGVLLFSSSVFALDQHWKLVATFPDPATACSDTLTIELADFKRPELCGEAVVKLTDIKKTDTPFVMGVGRLKLEADKRVSYSCVLFMK